MEGTSGSHPHRDAGAAAAGAAWQLAVVSLIVLTLGALLFGSAWAIGGDDAVSDNWVGMTVVVALFAGLLGSFVALLVASYAGLRHHRWSELVLPLVTFPSVVAAVALLEAFVFE
jgi:ABC-type Fe3+ transport system permease subunit